MLSFSEVLMYKTTVFAPIHTLTLIFINVVGVKTILTEPASMHKHFGFVWTWCRPHTHESVKPTRPRATALEQHRRRRQIFHRMCKRNFIHFLLVYTHAAPKSARTHLLSNFATRWKYAKTRSPFFVCVCACVFVSPAPHILRKDGEKSTAHTQSV